MLWNHTSVALVMSSCLAGAAPASALELWTLEMVGTMEDVWRTDGHAYDPSSNVLVDLGIDYADPMRFVVVFDADTPASSVSPWSSTYDAVRKIRLEAGSFVHETVVSAFGLGQIAFVDLDQPYNVLAVSIFADAPGYDDINYQSLFEGVAGAFGSPVLPPVVSYPDIYYTELVMRFTPNSSGGDYEIKFDVDSFTLSPGDAFVASSASVPLPAPALLLGVGLVGLFGMARRHRG